MRCLTEDKSIVFTPSKVQKRKVWVTLQWKRQTLAGILREKRLILSVRPSNFLLLSLALINRSWHFRWGVLEKLIQAKSRKNRKEWIFCLPRFMFDMRILYVINSSQPSYFAIVLYQSTKSLERWRSLHFLIFSAKFSIQNANWNMGRVGKYWVFYS